MATTGGRGEQLEVHLLATARAVRRAYDVRLTELDLHMTESGLLQILAAEVSLSQTELADRLHIGRSATGAFIEGLVARGFIERRRDPSDGRIWRISNTATGNELAGACSEMNQVIARELRSGLTRTEQHQMHILLAQIRANADGLGDVDAARGTIDDPG